MPRILTDTDIDNLVSRYATGETKKQLMSAFGIGHKRFIDALSSRGMSTISQGERTRALNDVQASELVARYIAGEGTQELGAAYGISSRIVTDYLRRAEIAARPKHHGIVNHMATLTPAERSAMTSKSMLDRWANATPEQRRAMVKPAHNAWRGQSHSVESLEAIADARASRGGSDSAYEEQVAQWLTDRGVEFTQQVAVGEFCADFAVGNTLVEVTTGWARKKQWDKRFTRFFDEGWDLYVIWHDTRVAMLPIVADDLIAWNERIESDPSGGSQHRVVWRSRKVLSTGRRDGDYVANILKSATPRGSWALYDSARHKA